MFLIAIDSEVIEADYVELWHKLFYWNPLFICAVQDWEVDFVAKLLEDLYEIKISMAMLINWCGSLCKAKASTWRATTIVWGGGGGEGGGASFL